MKDYNKYVLPVQSINQTVNVSLGLKLSQISDIDERNQIMTTNVWLEHVSMVRLAQSSTLLSSSRRSGRITN